MFVWKEKKSSRAAARAANAIDLIIEFATLGEYGLEYPESTDQSSRKNDRIPEIRLHQERPGSSPQRHRHGRRTCRPGRTRVDLPGWGDRPAHEIPGAQPGRRHRAEGHRLTESRRRERNRPSSSLPDALRPPRIRIEAA